MESYTTKCDPLDVLPGHDQDPLLRRGRVGCPFDSVPVSAHYPSDPEKGIFGSPMDTMEHTEVQQRQVHKRVKIQCQKAGYQKLTNFTFITKISIPLRDFCG
jgi:hypothetical protein